MNIIEAASIASTQRSATMQLEDLHQIAAKVTRARFALEMSISLGRVRGLEQMYMTTLQEAHQAACEAMYGSDWRKFVDKTYGGLK